MFIHLASSCFKADVFATGSLKDKCIVVKIGVIPNSHVNAFPVMTKDFDVFNPYDQPLSGKVTQVDLYDCDTMEKIQVTPTEEKLVRMKLVGGNDCVFFDEETQAFIQKDLNQGNCICLHKTIYVYRHFSENLGRGKQGL